MTTDIVDAAAGLAPDSAIDRDASLQSTHTLPDLVVHVGVRDMPIG